MIIPVEYESKVHVELIETWGSDKTVVNSARVSYNKDDNFSKSLTEKDEKLINYLMTNNHSSPFEHAGATFHIHAPIFVARQWMRHRTQSYNEQSARYTELDEIFFVPSTWRLQSQKNKQGSSEEYLIGERSDEADAIYEAALQASRAAYRSLLKMGVSREIARCVLPVSIYTRFYASANLWNWIRFLDLRDSEHAQVEIRQAASDIRKILNEKFPVSMSVKR